MQNKLHGFTLIEILITLVILSFAMIGTITIYNSITDTISTEITVNEKIFNARSSIKRISHEVKKAGFKEINRPDFADPTPLNSSTQLLTNITTP